MIHFKNYKKALLPKRLWVLKMRKDSMNFRKQLLYHRYKTRVIRILISFQKQNRMTLNRVLIRMREMAHLRLYLIKIGPKAYNLNHTVQKILFRVWHKKLKKKRMRRKMISEIGQMLKGQIICLISNSQHM